MEKWTWISSTSGMFPLLTFVYRNASVDLIASIPGYYSVTDGKASSQGMGKVCDIMENSEEFIRGKITVNKIYFLKMLFNKV